MKSILIKLFGLCLIINIQCSVNKSEKSKDAKVIFLHHSTGEVIFRGGVDNETGELINIPNWLSLYNESNSSKYSIKEQAFPKEKPYGWKNYPYDYYDIWVKNSGPESYKEEPTLEILTKEYDIIIFKHCFPVSGIVEDSIPDINSEIKTLGNYKLQYEALKEKLHSFPETKFLVWTGAALTDSTSNVEEAKRAKAFSEWVKTEWDEPGDNIFIWDFYALETEGGLFLKPEYATGPFDPHPTREFARKVVPLFGQRIVDVIENDGNNTTLKGESK